MKYFFSKFFLALVFIFLVNFYLRRIETGSYARSLSYDQLYYDGDRTFIRSIDITDGSLEVSFDGKNLERPANHFRVFDHGRMIEERQVSGKKFTLKPTVTGLTKFDISVNGSADTVSLDVDYSNNLYPGNSTSQKNNSYEIISNVPVAPDRLYRVDDWMINYWGDDTAGISQTTGAILTDSMGVKQDDGSEEKILKISKFILARTERFKGRPENELSSQNPLKQLSMVQAGKSKIWCGNYAAILSFFASRAGLPVRLVSSGKSDKGYSSGIHVFCEVYIKENQCWAFVDLMSGNILVRYKNKLLNTLDLQRLMRYNITDTSLVSCYFEHDSLNKVPFSNSSGYLDRYFYPDNSFTFYYGHFLKIMQPKDVWERGLKFFYLQPYYAIYSDSSSGRNYLFYARVFTNYLLAIMLFIYLIRLLFGMTTKRSRSAR